MAWSNFTSGAVMFRDRVVLRTPDSFFYQLTEVNPPTSVGMPVEPPSADTICGGQASRVLPGLVRMASHPGPKFYLNVQGNIVDFLYGSFVGIYIGYRLGYLQNGVNLEMLKHVYMGADGNLDVGGSWRIWWRWFRRDPCDSIYILWRIFVYGMGGGALQTLMRILYRWIANSDGHVVPAAATFTFMSIGDDNFFAGGYMVLGNLLYYTAIYEAWMMAAFRGNSTYWVRHFMDRYLLRYFRFIHRPRNWWGDIPLHEGSH